MTILSLSQTPVFFGSSRFRMGNFDRYPPGKQCGTVFSIATFFWDFTMFSIAEIIDLAVKIEKNGEAVYRQAIDQSKNQALKELLVRVADEERDHAAWFQSLLADIEKEQPQTQVQEMDAAMLEDLIGKQSFSLADIDFSGIENSRALVDIFIEFENDTILFYEMLKTFLTDAATVDHLEKIIQEETLHIQDLEDLRRSEKPF